MNKKQALVQAKALLREDMIYNSVLSLLLLDMRAYMPPSGRPYRVECSTYFEKARANLFMTDEAQALARWFREQDTGTWENDLDKAVARRYLARYDSFTEAPTEIQHEMSFAHFEADAAWHEARRLNDYSVFRPALQKIFDVKRKVAEAKNPNKHPLEVLINTFDEDLTVETCSRLLSHLKRGVIDIMSRVLPASRDVDDSFLKIFEKNQNAIDELARYVCHRFGYTQDVASFAKIVHPWSPAIGPRDSRVTTAKYKDGLGTIFTAAHEMGHALYSIGSSDEVIEAGIWGGMKGSAHESQSRFYENVICRSVEFWQFFYPFVQARFPELLSYDLDEFCRAVLKPQPSLIRTQADELTYSLHPIIRFEIEKELFDGKLDLAKLPEVWADKYEECLGIRPDNDLEGCLQDIHWTEDFGKFQAYPMGNIFDGQLLRPILTDIPDFYDQVTRGEFADILKWFRGRIHQYGFTYPTMALMERASGSTISAQPFVDYLKDKYFKLYDVKE